MIPHDPEPPLSPPEPAIVYEHPVAAQRWPFWGYQDLLVFISLAFPTLLLSALIVKAATRFVNAGTPLKELLVQIVWYVLVFSALYALLRLRYQQPFWRSLGWGPPFRGANLAFIGGPPLALGIGYVGYLIHTPEIQMPFKQMLEDRPTLVLFSILAVVVGPLCEELAFRGFLMPLLIRSMGAMAGIVITGLLFGSLHAAEYQWSWKHVLLISTAGVTFGWVRYKTGSTAASTFMHSSYNLTQLAAFLAQSRAL